MNFIIVPGPTPVIISHEDLYDMGLNYQTYYKIIERPEYVYTDSVKMRNYLPFLSFPRYGFLCTSQLRNIHRHLRHPSVEMQMRINERANVDDVPDSTRKKIVKIVKHCHAGQLKRGKPRRFLFTIRDHAIGSSTMCCSWTRLQ